jgi:hypothetical protein
MGERRTLIWGWGYEDQQPTPEQKKAIAKGVAASLGRSDLELAPEPKEGIKTSGSGGQRSSFLSLKIWIPLAERSS